MGKVKKTTGSLRLIDECITDAKALMEISLFNAQEKLKERFTPQLKSLIAKRLRQEEDELEDDDLEDGENFNDIEGEEEAEIEDEDLGAEEEEIDLDVIDDEDLGDEEEIGIEGIEDDEDEAVAGLEDAEMDIDVDDLEDEEEEEEEINLEAIMKQMEDLSDDDEVEIEDDEIEDDEVEIEDDEIEDDEIEDDEIEDDEIEDDDEVEIEDDEVEIEEDEDLEFDIEDDDEVEIEDDEVEDDDLEIESLKARNKKLTTELRKYKAGTKLFKRKIAEQKFVQAKLLYVNDMLKRKKLSEMQKYKIVEAFDKAKNISDIKLIYKTLFEAYKDRQKKIKATKSNTLREGTASKAILVNRKKRIIRNKVSNPIKDRYQLLANIRK